jgi:hypothetical protein
LARSLEAVNVNGYTIKPGANLEEADLWRLASTDFLLIVSSL